MEAKRKMINKAEQQIIRYLVEPVLLFAFSAADSFWQVKIQVIFSRRENNALNVSLSTST